MEAPGETKREAELARRTGRRRLGPLFWWSSVLLILPLLYLVVNLMGERRLEAVKRDLAEKGESLSLRDFCPVPIPAEQNFCAIPLLDGINLEGDSPAAEAAKEKRSKLEAMFPPRGKKNQIASTGGGPEKGVPTDLAAHVAKLRAEGYFKSPPAGTPAEDILSAYASMQPLFDQMAGALERPSAQWTPTMVQQPTSEVEWITRQPVLSLELDFAKHFAMRGVIPAQARDSAAALAYWRMAERLRRATAELPATMNLLVALVMHQFQHRILWECEYAQAGTLDEWRLWEREQAAIDYKKIALNSWGGERAFSWTAAGLMKRNRRHSPLVTLLSFNADIPGGEQGAEGLAHLEPLFPGGVYDLNAASVAQLQTKYLMEPLEHADWATFLAQPGLAAGQLQEVKDHPFTHLDSVGAWTVSNLLNSIYKIVYAVAQSNQATIACRLEIYRLEHGSYPDSLAGISLSDGRPLPVDPIDGAPMRYRRTEDGRFALWSIGFDRKDDGGRRAKSNLPSASDSTYVGDWVWSFTADPSATAPAK